LSNWSELRLRSTFKCVAFLAFVVACRFVPDENPDFDLVCWFVHCTSSGEKEPAFSCDSLDSLQCSAAEQPHLTVTPAGIGRGSAFGGDKHIDALSGYPSWVC
jgi:hypothetical protein